MGIARLPVVVKATVVPAASSSPGSGTSTTSRQSRPSWSTVTVAPAVSVRRQRCTPPAADGSGVRPSRAPAPRQARARAPSHPPVSCSSWSSASAATAPALSSTPSTSVSSAVTAWVCGSVAARREAATAASASAKPGLSGPQQATARPPTDASCSVIVADAAPSSARSADTATVIRRTVTVGPPTPAGGPTIQPFPPGPEPSSTRSPRMRSGAPAPPVASSETWPSSIEASADARSAAVAAGRSIGACTPRRTAVDLRLDDRQGGDGGEHGVADPDVGGGDDGRPRDRRRDCGQRSGVEGGSGLDLRGRQLTDAGGAHRRRRRRPVDDLAPRRDAGRANRRATQ